ncbi:MAG: helix-turn-helix domain-containing protein [Candidatus Paceibacterota bacterium]
MDFFTSVYTSELPHWAMDVYMHLADCADKDGKCYLLAGTIARELKLSRSTAKRAIADLEQSGHLCKAQRWQENGGKRSNLYYVMQPDSS